MAELVAAITSMPPNRFREVSRNYIQARPRRLEISIATSSWTPAGCDFSRQKFGASLAGPFARGLAPHFLMATLPRITANELLQVSIVGQIVGGTELGDGASGSAHCNWRLVAQPGWKHLFGEVAGASQSDMPDTSQSDMPESTMYVWCHPLDACFECENVRAQEAWPRLELEVRWRDIYDRSDLEGYGVMSVPPLPGVHQLVCRLWRPRGSMGERFVAYVMGGRPHLKNNGLILIIKVLQKARLVC